MFSSVVYYTDARNVLTKNGYTLDTKVSGGGATIRKGSGKVVEVNCGPFSAPFINCMLADAGLEGIMGLPVGFDKQGAKSKQGALAKVSEKLLKEGKEKGFTPPQLDCHAIKIFASSEIRTEGGHLEGLYMSKDAPLSAKDDFVDEDDDGKTIVIFTEEEGAPFYYKINMKRRNKAPEKIPAAWHEALAREHLTSAYDAEAGILYVANTVQASYGFPPNPRMLGVPILDVKIEDWEVTPASLSIASPQTNSGAAATAAGPIQSTGAWTDLVKQFMAAPSQLTYCALIDAESTRDAFADLGKQPQYKMGSNKNKQTSTLRSRMIGQANQKTYEEYAKTLLEVAVPNTEDYLMVLMMRMKGVVRQGTDGCIYFGQ